MPPVREHITGYVAGDEFNVRKAVLNVKAGRTIVKAWLTVKNAATDADPGVIQKVITTTAQGGVGQITDSGADGTGEVLFQFTKTDTGTTLGPDKVFKYDIQLKFDNGDIATLQYGDLVLVRGVTDASS